MQISVLSILLTDGFADGISLVVIKIFPLFNLSDGTEEVVKLVLTGVPSKFLMLQLITICRKMKINYHIHMEIIIQANENMD